MTAREFQESPYFDNILISTIRFLDAFPAKTPSEKSSFMRGLNKVLPSFPKSVMEKKVLPALLEELKDKELLSLILQNVFKIMSLLPSSQRAFGEKVRPKLKEIFVDNAKQAQEKDTARDAGLMVVLENTNLIAENSSGKEFKDGMSSALLLTKQIARSACSPPRISRPGVSTFTFYSLFITYRICMVARSSVVTNLSLDVLPILISTIESSTPSLVDAALRGLPKILPILDFSTIKNELFPVIAAVFSKTNSLAIKVRGCRAFVVLCGGSNQSSAGDDGLDGFAPDKKRKTSSSSALDKYTMQEKIVPLIKAIKTKEPAVMMASLDVLRVVGDNADAEFVAMEILPILWNMSLGPLLDLKQFQKFMELVKSLSRRVEDEQTKKLQELAVTNGATASTSPINDDFLGFGGVTGTTFDAANGTTPDDFELLVKGKISQTSGDSINGGWDATSPPAVASPTAKSSAAQFSWSTPTPPSNSQFNPPKPQPSFRTVTPDLAAFNTLTPQTTQFSQPLKPATLPVQSTSIAPPPSTGINWPSTTGVTPSPWVSASASGPMSPSNTSMNAATSSMSNMNINMNQQRPSMNQTSSFSLAPPPSGRATTSPGFSLPPPPPGLGQRQASSSSFGQASSSSFGLMSPPTGSMNSMMNPALRNGNTSMNSMMGGSTNVMAPIQPVSQVPQQPKQQSGGLDKYESLL